jgi:hypothetical protein
MSDATDSQVLTSGQPGFGLAAAIEAVRSELEVAVERGRSSPLAFTAGAVEMEFEVAFTKSMEGSGGIKAWVLSADFKGNQSTVTTHRITVSLTPKDRATGKDIQVSDVSAE